MNLQELIERTEKATGPSVRLDADICAELRLGPAHAPEWLYANFPKWRGRDDGRCEAVHTDGTGGINWTPEPLSSSLDAVLQLVERQNLDRYAKHKVLAEFADTIKATDELDPRTLLAILLRALQAQDHEVGR